MQDALETSFKDGRLRIENRDALDAHWWVLKQEANFAGLAAFEFADAQGPFGGDARVRDEGLGALESVSAQFRSNGRVGGGDLNTPYFTLVPVTRALLKLRGKVDETRHRQLVDHCVRLYAAAAAHIDRTHDYLNPRAMEAVSALGLHRLTGERSYGERCVECLDELLKRQYRSGALPYRTDKKFSPTQGYQFLSADLVLYLGRELDRPDAVDYARRVADYALLATNRHGEAFSAVFVGFNKSRTLGCTGYLWTIATALGDERFRGLARTAYERWMPEVRDFGFSTDDHKESGVQVPTITLNDALYLGVEEVPRAEPFVPKPGVHLLPDISTVFVHEPGLDLAMNLLGNSSALVEADCGAVKLFALTPEFTDRPTFQNAGISSNRPDWSVPSEQLECIHEDGKARLRNQVRAGGRLLDVTTTYVDGELVLEYQTVKDTGSKPVSSRLLFLLIARPGSAPPRLRVGGEVDTKTPPAESKQTYFLEAAVDPVRFSAPDGSTIEIVPEVSTAEKITAERPADRPDGDEDNKGAKTLNDVKPANEGSLRLAFEGPNVFDRGRYRIRFRPA